MLFNALDDGVCERAVGVEQVDGLTPAVVINGGCVWLAFGEGVDGVAVDGVGHGVGWLYGNDRGNSRGCQERLIFH